MKVGQPCHLITTIHLNVSSTQQQQQQPFILLRTKYPASPCIGVSQQVIQWMIYSSIKLGLM